MRKYICYGGHVRSRNDKGIHYIPASRLPQLYNVDPQLCIFINGEGDLHKLKAYKFSSLYMLKPRGDGKYDLQSFI